MQNFVYSIPTTVYFGRKMLDKLGSAALAVSNRVLLVYGGGSIKKNGIYAHTVAQLEKNGIFFAELPGVQPNPRVELVREGIKICREHNLGLIIAVGGGSVIDCAKAIAAGRYYEGDVWDLFTGRGEAVRALPIASILTMAGTGSEMNGNTVITNESTNQKLAVRSELLRPVFSILDPIYTFSVPPYQTAAGVTDIMSHVFEQYFASEPGTDFQDNMCFAVLRTCIKYGTVVLDHPDNYDARANIMWASSIGLNGLLSYGRVGDWATHMIEHVISAVYDVTHGAGLAILTPHWMEFVLNENTAGKFVAYGKNVWGLEGDDMAVARQAIEKTAEFFKKLGMPSRLRDVGVDEARLGEMADIAVASGPVGVFRKLGREDVLAIYKKSF